MRKKMLISIALIVILLLNCIAPVLKVAADTDSAVILESNLYAAIKAELLKQGINAIYNDAQRTLIISDEEIAKVTTLSLSNCGLTDLKGLEIFTNLTSLDLSSNELNKDSSLEVLNSFKLSKLDLSSNAIEDVSMISDIKNIPTLNLHNQKFNVVEIIDVDTTENSDQYNGIIYPLPQILTSNVDYIESEWLIEKNYSFNTTESRYAPYIDWSGFDHQNLKVVYADKTDVSYDVRYGMVKVSIRVSDSTNTLYNSDINMYFVVADSNERGIFIKDTNMYNAIKKQLTRGQYENSDLISYGYGSESRNIYERYFDEPQVLVISIDDLVNKIPSLKLSNKRIRDLTGIEKFVGLELELDLSGNYIKSIDKLIELQENQEKEESLLKERVNAQLALVSEAMSKLEAAISQLEAAQKALAEANKKWSELDAKRLQLNQELLDLYAQKDSTTTNIDTLQEEIRVLKEETLPALQADLDTLNAELETAINDQKVLNDQILAYNAQIADLEKQIEDSTADDQDLRDQIDAKKAAIEDAKNKIALLQNDIANKENAIKTKTEEMNQTVATITDKKNSIATYETKLADINIQISEKLEELGITLTADGSQLGFTTLTDADITTHIDTLKTTISNALDADTNVIAARASATPEAINTATTYYTETVLTSLTNGYKLRNQYVDELLTLMTTPSTTDDAIKAKCDEMKNALQSVIDDINTAVTTVNADPILLDTTKTILADAYTAELNNFTIDAAFVTKAIDLKASLNSDLVTQNQVLQTMYAERENMLKRISELETEISDELTNNKNDLQLELDTLNTEKTDLENQKKALEDSIPQLETELDDLNAQLAASSSAQEVEALKQQIADIQAQIDDIKNNQLPQLDQTISITKESITIAQKKVDDVNAQIDAKQKEIDTVQKGIDDLDKKIEAKLEEIKKLAEEMNKQSESTIELKLKVAELQAEVLRLREILLTRMARLYNIYNRIDRLTAFATLKVRTMTEKELYDLTFEEAKGVFDEQVSKISNIEEYLTPFESRYLIDVYDIPTEISAEIEKVIVNPDGTTSVITVTETKPIENPISKYFSELANDDWTLSTYKSWLYNFRTDDIYFAMYSYCYMYRFFNGTEECVADNYADYIIRRLEIDREPTGIYEAAKNTYSTVYAQYASDDECEGIAYEDNIYAYAKRILLATGEEINAYVELPRLKVLNVSENLIENIDNLDKLTKLVEFYAGDNEIVDISNVNWTAINEHLKVLDLSLNDISNIAPLEVLTHIVELDLSHNLISGEFTFRIEKLEDLEDIDLSYNQIDDIQRLINYLAYEARAYGYDGDIASYLRRPDTINVNFQFQQLTMTIEDTLPIGGTTKVALPKIFEQIEKIDYANTSFGIDSLRGNVTSDGKYAILDTSVEGKHVAEVIILNTKVTPSLGYGTVCQFTYRVGDTQALFIKITPEKVTLDKGATQQFTAQVTGENVQYDKVSWSVLGNTSENTTITNEGLLTIAADENSEEVTVVATSIYDITVSSKAIVTIGEDKEPVDPAEPTDPDEKDPTDPTGPADPVEPSNPEDPTNPDETEHPVADIELGYKLEDENDFVVGISPKTPVEDFKTILLKNNSDYKVVIKSEGKEITTGNVRTGMFVQIQNKDGVVVADNDKHLRVYEVVVKGDVNGDGYADSMDSVLIKAFRNEVENLTGAAYKAADINSDKQINITDSKLLLYHRAEVKGYDLNYTK